ncbi:uncharacterized protein LOC113360526 [Papaver somniferum]|uniref:uncharacterized protein LOC113360526 n=1 Tax=Papaver somniferum TaxID=3469 RepID=UPI000E7037E5|nr:uncharacterized protein LOC113360526 [Papaver somniferum]
MQVLFWYINGVAREAAHCKIRDLIREFKPDIFCLAEPKVACSTNFGKRLQMEGFSPDIIHNSSVSGIANLWVYFLNEISSSVVNMSKQAITIEVEGVHISFVHARYVQVTRRSLWQQLSVQDTTTPWLVMGDFNCILRLDEKKGGLEPSTSAINEFSDWMHDNNLFEADSLGTKFTWTNRKSGSDRIIRKLDITVINYAWLAKYENLRCKALPREVSDHSTLLGYPFVVSRPKRAPFRIQKMWFLHSDFIRMVQDSWNMPVHGLPDFIFPFKLKRLKGVMKEWNLLVFGNIHSRLKQDQLRFETVARISDEDPTDIAKLNIMKDVMNTLGETKLQHTTMLKQKSRNQWLVEGSSNSNFFHNSIRIRRSSNTIYELVDSNGATISDYDQLRDHVVNYYEEKFNGQDLDYDMDLFDFFHDSITAEESIAMDQIPSPKEIKQEVFHLGAGSAPGPDGFSGCFYHHCWDIIQDDLVKAVIHCWGTGHIPNGVNSSLIILLAKVRGANNLRNFRPIGLSNFFFKIFTKILATRLSSFLDRLVSEEHVAFMKGRNILSFSLSQAMGSIS